jgi:hypothetical protein
MTLFTPGRNPVRLRQCAAIAAAPLIILGLAACGGSGSSADASASSAALAVDCADLLGAMQTHVAAISLVLQAGGGTGVPVTETEAGEFQVTVDRVAAAMPPLPADAEPYLDMSQELADILNTAAVEGLTFDEVLPDFEAVLNDPAYQAASEAGEAVIMPQCPTPSGAAS